MEKVQRLAQWDEHNNKLGNFFSSGRRRRWPEMFEIYPDSAQCEGKLHNINKKVTDVPSQFSKDYPYPPLEKRNLGAFDGTKCFHNKVWSAVESTSARSLGVYYWEREKMWDRCGSEWNKRRGSLREKTVQIAIDSGGGSRSAGYNYPV